jgi:predicted DNA-binding transcriptional regulator AlpA
MHPPRREAPTADRILRTSEVAELLGISRASLWRWRRAGHFPPPRILGQGTTRPVHGWLESEVAEWIASRPPLEQE